MEDTQQGATITFSVTGGTWNVVNIGRFSMPIPVIDITKLSSTTTRKKKPGELADPQPVVLTIQNDPTAAEPARGAIQTITITGPVPPGEATGETWAGTGFVIDVRSPSFSSDSENLQTKEIEFIWDGATGPARTAAA